jgi:NADH-quinone oxidoreductase subunit L
MNNLIYIFFLLPLLGLLFSLLISKKSENAISYSALGANALSVLFTLGFIAAWGWNGFPNYSTDKIALYSSEHYEFILLFYFDKVGAVYLGFSSILFYLISVYSRYYLHREEGYKRFFNTIMLFIVSINIIVLSGNFETLFLGWEVLGLSSFLLIGYYRDRYLPVRNALKVYSIYRVADVGLLLTMWLSHQLWHENITFAELNDTGLVAQHLQSHYGLSVLIALFIGLAAAAKSAQFPFSNWLARAMEGPTPSSAIFYGSVAVHIGVFLLLRTYPFWEGLFFVKIFFILMSLITAFVASTSSEVQSSIKAQIAYASIAQIAIIFIEVVLGWHNIALIHLTGNAFLRAYQLLISPSIVTYLMREQFFTYQPEVIPKQWRWQRVWRNTILVAGIKEWKLDSWLYKFLWNPLKQVGKSSDLISVRVVFISSTFVIAVLSAFLFAGFQMPLWAEKGISLSAGCVGLMLSLIAFSERRSVRKAWLLLTICHFWLVVSVGYNDTFSWGDTAFYLSGVILSGTLGFFILTKLQSLESFDLNDFHGLIYRRRWYALAFLWSCLAMAGFPITTTFLGEDLLFTHIHEDQILLAIIVSLIFVTSGIALMRMYSRIFLGPYKSAENVYANRFS